MKRLSRLLVLAACMSNGVDANDGETASTAQLVPEPAESRTDIALPAELPGPDTSSGRGDADGAEEVAEVDIGLGEVVASGDTTFLTSLVLDNGNQVEFWQQSEGAILVSESGRYPTSPSIGRSVAETTAETLDIYARLAPTGVSPPEQLLRAAERESRLRELAAADPGIAAGPLAAPIGRAPGASIVMAAPALGNVDTSACPWSWFDNQFSLVTQGPADPDNWSYEQRTGTTWYLNGRMSIVLASACSYRGNVRFSFWSKPSPDSVWTYDQPTLTRVLHAGEWYWVLSRAEWWYQEARDIYSEVSYASGDGYHHKGVGCDRKAFSQCAVNAPDGSGYWGE